MKTSRLVLAIFFSWLQMTVCAQQRSTEKINQQWLQYHLETKVSGHWAAIFDLGYRWQEQLSRRYLYITQITARYQAARNLQLAMGLGHTGLYRSTQIGQLEFRPYQELQSKHQLGKTEIGHRIRIEERWLKKIVNGESTGENSFAFRFRYNLSWNIPLFNWTHGRPDHQVSLNIADEIFFNAGKNVVYNVFDKNRISLGTAIQLNKSLAVNFVYNSQFAALNAPARFTNTDISMVRLVQKIDLIKKRKEMVTAPSGD